jgi:hypothetical protein
LTSSGTKNEKNDNLGRHRQLWDAIVFICLHRSVAGDGASLQIGKVNGQFQFDRDKSVDVKPLSDLLSSFNLETADDAGGRRQVLRGGPARRSI